MIISIILVVLFLSVLVVVHEFGHFIAAKLFGITVLEFGVGFPPAILRRKIGETVYSVNAIPAGGFVRLKGEERSEQSLPDRQAGEQHPNAPVDSDRFGRFSDAAWWKRALVIVGGVSMNFIVGWLLISFIFMIGIPGGLIITGVAPGSPAETAGMKEGDKIISLIAPDARFLADGDMIARRFSEFIDAHRGDRITAEVTRGGETERFGVVPRVHPPEGEGAMGVAIIEEGITPQPFFRSLREGFTFSLKLIQMFFGFIGEAIAGRADFRQISGPVGIVKVASEAGRAGITPITQLVALISLNLAVINILPFPALDGGRLLFLILEKIKGSPLPLSFERYANMVGFALLIALLVVVTVKDIIQF
ncbi:site-2 protease family protein [Candidatus Wolfebacteria bacterium]|nr:site-2 protease family protein [Candidatus Wolfebacteria bacterium]